MAEEEEGSFQVAEGSLRVAAAEGYKPAAAAEVGGSQLAADAYNSGSDFTKSVLLQSIW